MDEQIYPTRAEVVERLLSLWDPEWTAEAVRTEDAIGRVPSEDQYARHSLPVVRCSAMDGVAVRSADFAAGIPDTSGWKLGWDFIRADTGDDFDDRFDAVIRIEDVDLAPEGRLAIHPGVEVKPGLGVRPCGSMLREGEILVRKDRPLRAVDLAALVMGGVPELPVYRKPRVAFLPTGDELIPPWTPLTRGKNYDTNSILAKHLLLEMGADPVLFPIVRDDRGALEAALEKALAEADIVLLNGGSSKGREDLNARLLEERGQAVCHGVGAAPGKPMCAAVLEGKPVINLPGPPAALFYGMDWCVRGLINHLLRLPMPKRQTVEAVLTAEIDAPPHMEILCKMNLEKTDQGYEAFQMPHRGSSTVRTLCADAMYITKLGTTGHPAGERIPVELLRGEEYFGREEPRA